MKWLEDKFTNPRLALCSMADEGFHYVLSYYMHQ